jgi:hypothetical protein
MNIISFCDIFDYDLIENIDENKRDIRLYSFKNIKFTGFSSYYPDILFKPIDSNFLILPLKEMSMSLNTKSYYEENGMIFKDNSNKNIDENQFKIINEKVYYFIYNTDNYYHFIYDTLPYLYCFLKLKHKNINLKLLINFNKNKTKLLPFVKETLELLNITENDIIFHNENNIYSKIYLSSSLTHNGLSNSPPRKEIFEIYNSLVQNSIKYSHLHNNLIQSNIYISRRTWINSDKSDNIGTNYTTRRKLVNENELVDKLIDNNFVEIFGENLSMIEKIILFNNAKIIIGAVGGTITNCIFCNEKCKIITLISPYFLDINYRMKFLFNNNVIFFNDTYLDCNEGDIPINTRIKIIDDNYYNNLKIGEIEKKNDNDLYSIKIINNLIGLNNEELCDKIILHKNEFELLDNGINSPWKVDLLKLIETVNNLYYPK